jgi:hypothetical protein
MMKVENVDHFRKAMAFAKANGAWEGLKLLLRYLSRYGTKHKTLCKLFPDHVEDHSWIFDMLMDRGDGAYEHWFRGGLILHPDDCTWHVHT